MYHTPKFLILLICHMNVLIKKEKEKKKEAVIKYNTKLINE